MNSKKPMTMKFLLVFPIYIELQSKQLIWQTTFLRRSILKEVSVLIKIGISGYVYN